MLGTFALSKIALDAAFFVAVGWSIFYGRRLFRRHSDWTLLDRLTIAAIPLASVFIVAIALREILEGPFHMWESVRLLPSFLIARGLPHYYPLDSGPILDMMYGPVTAFAYYPVTLLTHHSTTATMVAKLFTYTYYFLPVILLFYRRGETPSRAAFTTLCLLAFALYSHETDVLAGSGYANHSDAPALGLGAMACVLILKRRFPSDRLFIFFSAVCAVLSVWTKQVMIPIVFAIPIYLAISEGRSSCFRYIGYMVLCSTCASVFFGNMFGFARLWSNLVINPCRQPWEGIWVKVQGRAIVELMDECRWLCLLGILYMMYVLRTVPEVKTDFRRWFGSRDWSLLFIVGVCMIPTALIGRVKAGGGLNALSFCVYFTVIAIGLVLREIVDTKDFSPVGRIGPSLVKAGFIFGVVSSTMIHALTLSYFYMHLAGNIAALETNPLLMGSRFIEQHPDQVYLPWNCLTSFLTEGKLYHFDYALLDREIGGAPVTMQHFRQNIPSKLRWVAFPPSAQDQFVMKFLPEFSKQISLPELPGWIIYIRPDDEDAAHVTLALSQPNDSDVTAL